jgi:hypothetical protein
MALLTDAILPLSFPLELKNNRFASKIYNSGKLISGLASEPGSLTPG